MLVLKLFLFFPHIYHADAHWIICKFRRTEEYRMIFFNPEILHTLSLSSFNTQVLDKYQRLGCHIWFLLMLYQIYLVYSCICFPTYSSSEIKILLICKLYSRFTRCPNSVLYKKNKILNMNSIWMTGIFILF